MSSDTRNSARNLPISKISSTNRGPSGFGYRKLQYDSAVELYEDRKRKNQIDVDQEHSLVTIGRFNPPYT